MVIEYDDLVNGGRGLYFQRLADNPLKFGDKILANIAKWDSISHLEHCHWSLLH